MRVQYAGIKRLRWVGLVLVFTAVAMATAVMLGGRSQVLRAEAPVSGAVGSGLSAANPAPGAEARPEYVGVDACKGCHKPYYDTWKFTAHRQTNVPGDRRRPEEKGCEACHGPGGRHVAAGGGKGTMINLERARPAEITRICLRCHTQREVTLWPTSYHVQNKLSCVTCHSGHVVSREDLLKDIDSLHLTIRGLDSKIKDAELGVNSKVPGSPEYREELCALQMLQDKRTQDRKTLAEVEGRYRRYYEPDQCFGCHKNIQVRINMQSRHPIQERKILCSDCHNPHGGTGGSNFGATLREERVVELCVKCHGQYAGPFVFEHPPVTEDCTICHNPHGSPQRVLLVQSEPFLCLRCHAGPHSRSETFTKPASIGQFYNNCTGCHNHIHGSDRHPAFHY